MNELQLFNFDGIHGIRVMHTEKEPMFVARDVCDILELGDTSKAVERLSPSMKGTNTVRTPGGNQEMLTITEAGIYKLVFTSRKPEAERFTDWLASEVLPSIRKHGMYATDELLDNPDLLIQVATELKKAREEKKLLEDTIEQQKPQVLFAASVTASSTSILVADLAKILKKNGIEIGEIRLWEWLRKNKYVISEKGRSYNMPTQKSMELKVMEIKEGTRIDSKGNSKITKTTLVTGKGQVYFVNKFLVA